MNIYLETARLRLRRFTPDDVDRLVELDSDPAVMRYINGGRPTPRSEFETDILPWWLSYYERHTGYGLWAAVETAGLAFIGWFHLWAPEAGSSCGAELGYRLRAAAWGRGYATEGTRALIERAFRECGAERVFAETMAVNVGSRRVMEKSGLRFVRAFHQEWPDRIEGEEHGDVEYALTRAEWEGTLPAHI
jgi:RimJ/RimL family protein N-acetyltransferase